jgi:hypothetical protein
MAFVINYFKQLEAYLWAKHTVNNWIKENDPRKPLCFIGMGLTSLPDIPSNCETLICWNNNLTSLPDLPNCRRLECNNNKITKLPELPECDVLNCENNQLTELPELPRALHINCQGNKLTKMPKILPKCIALRCNDNELESLPVFEYICRYLDCHNNRLRELPKLRDCEWLDCSRNKLKELPNLPRCKYLNCSDNCITRLPKKLDWFKDGFNCSGNKYMYISAGEIYKTDIKHIEPENMINYGGYAKIIQRRYRKHYQNKCRKVINQFVCNDPAGVVCSYM